MNCWHYSSVSLISLIFPIIARSNVHTTETLNRTNKTENQLVFLPAQGPDLTHGNDKDRDNLLWFNALCHVNSSDMTTGKTLVVKIIFVSFRFVRDHDADNADYPTQGVSLEGSCCLSIASHGRTAVW